MIATGEERLLVLDRSRRVARGGVEAGGSSGCRRYRRVVVVEEKLDTRSSARESSGYLGMKCVFCVVVDLVMMRDRRWVGSRRYKQEPPEIFFQVLAPKSR